MSCYFSTLCAVCVCVASLLTQFIVSSVKIEYFDFILSNTVERFVDVVRTYIRCLCRFFSVKHSKKTFSEIEDFRWME